MTDMQDFFNWARSVQSNNLETADIIRDVVSKQYGGNEDSSEQSLEDTIRSVEDESIVKLDEGIKKKN